MVVITAASLVHLVILRLARSFNVRIGDFVNEYAIFIIKKAVLPTNAHLLDLSRNDSSG